MGTQTLSSQHSRGGGGGESVDSGLRPNRREGARLTVRATMKKSGIIRTT